jgi:hypothetical protein
MKGFYGLPDRPLHVVYMIFTLVATIWYPFWVSGGYLEDCWLGPWGKNGGFCIPGYVPVTGVLLAMWVANVFWFRERKKRTGKYW